MKAYLIDTTARTVAAVEWDGQLPQLYQLVGCSYVEARRLPQRPGEQGQDCAFLDEEGILRRPIRPFCAIEGIAYPVAGNVLITGPEHPLTGDQHEPLRTLQDVAALVRFLTPQQTVAAWNQQRMADLDAMQEMREAGINVIDGGTFIAAHEMEADHG